MEDKVLLGVNLLLLGFITYLIRSWFTDEKKETKELRNKVEELNTKVAILETKCDERHKE